MCRLSGGELFDRIAQEDSCMSEQQVNYMRQICDGEWMSVHYNLVCQLQKILVCRIAFKNTVKGLQKSFYWYNTIVKICRAFDAAWRDSRPEDRIGPVAEGEDSHRLKAACGGKDKKDGIEMPLDGQNHIKIATYDDYIVLQVCYKVEFSLF